MPETIGQRLKKAREYRNLTLEKVEEATHIRLQFLQALEADDFSTMPSPVQARGFLRNYAQYLELDLDQMVEELRTAGPELEPETEVVFEDQQVIHSPEPEESVSDGEMEMSSESFWQTWLRRVRKESGFLDEKSASQPEPEPAPSLESESISEGEADQSAESEANAEEARTEIRQNLSEYAG